MDCKAKVLEKQKAHVEIKPIYLILFIIFIYIGLVFIVSIWKENIEKTKNEALQLALTAEVGFQKSNISKLNINESDLELLKYKEIKNSLMNLVKLNNEFQFAYIFTKRNDKIYFLADSEPSDSEFYSPPGLEFTEANEDTYLPFQNGQPLVSKPISDRWGTWISVLIPMKDLETGEIIAVFGVDYPAKSWNDHAVSHTIESGLIVICILLLIIAFYIVFIRNSELREEKLKLQEIGEKLKLSEMQFKAIFNQVPIGIAIGYNDKYLESIDDERSSINPMFENITGRTKEELVNIAWMDITHPDDVAGDLRNYKKLMSGEIDGYDMEKRYIKPDGSIVWVHMKMAPLLLDNTGNPMYVCLIENISERKSMEKALYESERSMSVLLDNLPGMAYRCSYDREWTMQFVSKGCYELTGYKPHSLLNNEDVSYNQLIAPEYQEILWNEWKRVIKLKYQFKYEYEIITATGQRKWVFEVGQIIYNLNNNVEVIEGIIIDITEKKQSLFEIEYISNHDLMTGLYNHNYYEELKAKFNKENCLPLSIIIGDINGVRLINDAFGHSEGDKIIIETANIIKNCCRESDVLSRTGGDEFSILLPNTNKDELNEIIGNIERSCEQYNNLIADKSMSINLTIGYATKFSIFEDIQVVDKEAREYMYKRKLFENKSYHSSILSSIMATMYERSQETEEHAKRLSVLSKMIGQKMNLPQEKIDVLGLFAMLHDIGKIGIDNSILNKPGKLSIEEWEVMKRHPEIGYRIAMSTTELKPIAEYILTHHERWDGKGYPKGILGENIPLFSRILAVVDTYDAMTEDRVYRKAMTKEATMEEIKKNSGTQFDPYVVEIFINIEKGLN